jgi:hypothetical protein
MVATQVAQHTVACCRSADSQSQLLHFSDWVTVTISSIRIGSMTSFTVLAELEAARLVSALALSPWLMKASMWYEAQELSGVRVSS